MIIDLYVDGSYTKLTPNITKGGIVIVDGDSGKVLSIRHVNSENPNFTRANNAGGEVIAALIGIIESATICAGEKSIVNVYYDYRGVKDFITGAYTANAIGMVQYVQGVNKVLHDNPNIELKFVKVKAHSGVKYNEMADMVARGIKPVGYADAIKPDLTF